MRKYNSFTPVPSRQPPPAARGPLSAPLNQSISEAMEHWNRRKEKNSTAELEEDKESDSTGVKFQLQTEAGILSYKPSDYSNYTDFLRVVIEMMLAFNSSEVDPEFKKVIKKAFAAYESGESFDDEGDEDDDEDLDFVHVALENARSEAVKYEQGVKYISSMPKSEKLTLKILQAESESTTPSRVEKLLCKLTDIPPNIMHNVVHKNEPFTLPFEKASEVYVQLRMLGVILTVKSADTTELKKGPVTKKASASKKSVKKSTAKSGRGRTTVKKNTSATKATKPALTGSERLRATVGIIKD